MSISSEISRISQNVADSLNAVAAKGVIVPSGSTSDDLPDLIALISTGGGSGVVVTDTTDLHGGTIRTITATEISGTKTITQNGMEDVTSYAAVNVNVSGSSMSIVDEANATGITAVVTGDGGGGGGGATQHSIYFEFSDSTNTTIPVYYDNSLISTMITAYTPETYGAKTVDLAQLDGVTWYQRSTETWETIYNNTTAPNADTPYNYWWLSSLSDVYPTVGSVWRVTIDNTQWVLTAQQISGVAQGAVFIGNPKYSGGQDDGSGVTTNFYNAGWGAWVGDTEISTTNHTVKIERRVS